MEGLMETKLPLMIFTMPYAGHEWHIVGAWQRQGKMVEVLPSSRYEDLETAVRPFRALHRLRETRVLHINQGDADAKYVEAIRGKFGTEILSIKLPELEKACKAVDRAQVEADVKRWCADAEKIVEPSREEIVKSSEMYVAMRNLMAEHKAEAVTMNCLGMNLIGRGMGYPCLGFVRLNNALLAGVCEADLKSTLTQLIFTYLVGRPGFVTDPMFDLSNDTIIHAHCVAATQMEGPKSRPSAYVMRSHLEDNQGVSLQVRMPIGQKLSMARLIGTDIMLFSTGDAVDSPFTERGCRSKVTMRVQNVERFLSDWSCGLHRVLFYGDHTRDLSRFCRFANVKILREGIDDLQKVPGLEWEAHVHA
jgi:L-fucose isomerase-like protein